MTKGFEALTGNYFRFYLDNMLYDVVYVEKRPEKKLRLPQVRKRNDHTRLIVLVL